ncbi:MAG: tyrosine-type recombinase/integrase, partial [Acidobacteriota bacterium]
MKESFFHYLEFERGLAQNTLSAYRRDLGKLEDFANRCGRRVRNLTATDVRQFLRQLHRQGLSHRSIARIFSAVRGFYRFSAAEGRIAVDPTQQIESIKVSRKLPHYLSLEEVERLLTVPDTSTPAGLRDRSMLETLYATGLRVSELVSLRMEDLHAEAGYVLCRGKGRKERIVPLGRSALGWLKRYMSSARPLLVRTSVRWLFLSSRGGRMT